MFLKARPIAVSPHNYGRGERERNLPPPLEITLAIARQQLGGGIGWEKGKKKKKVLTESEGGGENNLPSVTRSKSSSHKPNALSYCQVFLFTFFIWTVILWLSPQFFILFPISARNTLKYSVSPPSFLFIHYRERINGKRRKAFLQRLTASLEQSHRLRLDRRKEEEEDALIAPLFYLSRFGPRGGFRREEEASDRIYGNKKDAAAASKKKKTRTTSFKDLRKRQGLLK